MDDKDGGPAFPKDGNLVKDPNTLQVEYQNVQKGMTLRDYFAGQVAGHTTCNFGEEDQWAQRCYLKADALLKARMSDNV